MSTVSRAAVNTMPKVPVPTMMSDAGLKAGWGISGLYADPGGENVFLSVDSRATKSNPFYKAWKTKSFTDGDISLHFILFDILYCPEIKKTLAELLEQIDDYLCGFAEPMTFDESTVRKKLKEYAALELICLEKQGRKVYYSRSADTDQSELRDAIDFFSEAAPCGVVGSYLLDKAEPHESVFTFKHHYIAQAMDSGILAQLFDAMQEKRYITADNLGRHSGVPRTLRLVPLKIYISAQNIGCGMYTVELGKVSIDFEKLDEAAHFIPSGRDVWEGCFERFDLTGLRCYRKLRQARRLEMSLGTLGGGNHFIEIDEAGDGNKYLMIHSGSRNLGKQVAEIYQKLAVELHSGKADYFEKRDALIQSYKEQGRRNEIQAALKELKLSYQAREADLPEDLCYLYGKYLEDYLHDVELCQAFACRSRERMARILLERCGLHAVSAFHTIHNYIDTKEMILRKGAIAAHKGELVLLPINMRDGSVLDRGKGNPEWNNSAPHGAGRLMSRSKAKESLCLEEYKKTMEGIYTTCINEFTLDEAPMAYKSLHDILDVIRASVEVIEVLKPLYIFKASNERESERGSVGRYLKAIT